MLLKTIGITVAAAMAVRGLTAWEEPSQPAPTWEAYDLAQIAQRSEETGRSYVGFLDRSTLSCGLYRLAAGSKDGQSPHEQDEVYQVLAGKAVLTIGDHEQPVGPGSVVFVAAKEPHRFHSIEEDLEVLVFFSKAAPGE